MALNQSNGAVRPTLPRSSDPPMPKVGRPFGPKAIYLGRPDTRGWKSAIRRAYVGKGLSDPELNKLVDDSLTLTRSFSLDLGVDCSSLRALTAARARAVVLSGHLQSAAIELGPTTVQGMKLLDAALKWDQRAERLAITSYDLSMRLRVLALNQRPTGPQPLQLLEGNPYEAGQLDGTDHTTGQEPEVIQTAGQESARPAGLPGQIADPTPAEAPPGGLLGQAQIRRHTSHEPTFTPAVTNAETGAEDELFAIIDSLPE